MSVYYEEIRALIDPEQADVSPEGSVCQEVSVIMTQDPSRPRQERGREAAIVTLDPERARGLAFCLLSLAEAAERIGGRR
ncbi:MAG: hypothetical protein WB507_08000 [Solirubrobacterales bacterium]